MHKIYISPSKLKADIDPVEPLTDAHPEQPALALYHNIEIPIQQVI